MVKLHWFEKFVIFLMVIGATLNLQPGAMEMGLWGFLRGTVLIILGITIAKIIIKVIGQK